MMSWVLGVLPLTCLASVTSVDVNWDKYLNYKQYMDRLSWLERNYTQVKVIKTGETPEGRDLKIAKVCKDKTTSKPSIWIDGGVYGNQWIGPMCSLYVLEQILKDNSVQQIFDFHLMVLMNPDGYEYSLNEDDSWVRTRYKIGHSQILLLVAPSLFLGQKFLLLY